MQALAENPDVVSYPKYMKNEVVKIKVAVMNAHVLDGIVRTEHK